MFGLLTKYFKTQEELKVTFFTFEVLKTKTWK